jgi:hypothetical protein
MTASISDLKDVGRPSYHPNYDETLVEICADFTDDCVEKSNSLDILVRHWAPAPENRVTDPDSPPQRLLTWVPLITGSASGGPKAAPQGRSNGDIFVRISSREHQKNYNACANLRPWTIIWPSRLRPCGRLSIPSVPYVERTSSSSFNTTHNAEQCFMQRHSVREGNLSAYYWPTFSTSSARHDTSRMLRRDHQPTAQITQPPKQNFGKISKGSENSENLWND